MLPVDQTTFGFPDGNCFAACVASILELPIAAVPPARERIERWLSRMGHYLHDAAVNEQHPPPAGFHILNAGSPRGPFRHAVVAYGTAIVHDPHPSRAGVVLSRPPGPVATLIIPFDPARADVGGAA